MLANFFKTAYRNIIKYKAYSLINFVGLTCGFSLALLIIAYVRSEIGYDRFHEKVDRLYRMRYTTPNGLDLAITPPPIAPLLKEHFKEVEEAARVYSRNVTVTRPGYADAFEETEILFVDSTIVDLLTFDWVTAKPRAVLRDPFTVVINEYIAAKYFGDQDPVGESLWLSGNHPFKIVGVARNFPQQSHLHFNMLVPYENMYDLETDQDAEALRKNLAVNFIISHSYTYVLLHPGEDPSSVDQGMEAFLQKFALPRYRVGQQFSLMPVTDIHLKSTLRAEPSPTNSMANLSIFIGVGLLTLIMACINYINMSTAQSFSRVKEVGIRKILGSMRHHLMIQFLAESFLFCFVSMAIAYAVFGLLLDPLNQVTGKHLMFAMVADGKLLMGSAALIVCITLLAGGYPAYFIATFQSVHSLKGNGIVGRDDQFLRKVLIVFQLAVACTLLSGSLLILRQLHYLQGRSLGFQKDGVINIPLSSQNFNSVFAHRDSLFQMRLQVFRNSVELRQGVVETTLSSTVPGLGATYRNMVPDGFTKADNLFAANMSVDYGFLRAYGMELVAGRAFDLRHSTDVREAFIVNEEAVRQYSWGTPGEAIGKSIEKEGKSGTVIGVVKDFNFASLTFPVSALVMELDPDQYNTLSVKAGDRDLLDIVAFLEEEWDKVFPEKAFEYAFLEEQLDGQYARYWNFGTIIQVFTGIAVLIVCLGVYGLVLFTVRHKVKEIGVRKVLGASMVNIMSLICRDFALLIFIGFVLAIPISFFTMDQWLANFSYHIEIDLTTYVKSLVAIFLVVMATIGYQAMQAALTNPVHSLRSE